MPGKAGLFFSESKSEFILLSYLIEHSPCDRTTLSALNEETVCVKGCVYSCIVLGGCSFLEITF